MEMLPEMKRKIKNVITYVKTTQLQNQSQVIPTERTHTLKVVKGMAVLDHFFKMNLKHKKSKIFSPSPTLLSIIWFQHFALVFCARICFAN